MANRTRSIVLRVPVTAEERALIELKMQQMGTRCFSTYARKMLIDGYVVKIDYSDIKAIVRNQGGIVAVNSAEGIKQHRPEILPDVADLSGVLPQTVKDKLDMAAVQLHKLAFYQLCRIVVSGNADLLAGTAYRFQNNVHDLVQAVTVNALILQENVVFDVIADNLPVNPICFIFAVCRFLSLPFRRRSRLFPVHAQRGGVRGKDRNGIGT